MYLNGFDFRLECQLTNISALVVVPNKYFIRRIPRILSTTYNRDQIAAEEHLNDPYPAVGKGSPHGLSERFDIEYSES
jgi:hypothetical protein